MCVVYLSRLWRRFSRVPTWRSNDQTSYCCTYRENIDGAQTPQEQIITLTECPQRRPLPLGFIRRAAGSCSRRGLTRAWLVTTSPGFLSPLCARAIAHGKLAEECVACSSCFSRRRDPHLQSPHATVVNTPASRTESASDAWKTPRRTSELGCDTRRIARWHWHESPRLSHRVGNESTRVQCSQEGMDRRKLRITQNQNEICTALYIDTRMLFAYVLHIRALHGANFGDPIQPAPFAQTHFHPFPGFQGKFSPDPPRFHVYEFYINCLLNAKKNSLSFPTNKELKHQDSINMFDRYKWYQMTKSWTLQHWMSNWKFCCMLQLYLWNLKIMINQS